MFEYRATRLSEFSLCDWVALEYYAAEEGKDAYTFETEGIHGLRFLHSDPDSKYTLVIGR